MPVTGDGQCMSRNAWNPNEFATLEIEHTIAGRNPQPSFVIEPQGLRSAHGSAVRDFGPYGAGLGLIRAAFLAECGSATIHSHSAVCPAIQSVRRADPYASVWSRLYRAGIRIWETLV